MVLQHWPTMYNTPKAHRVVNLHWLSYRWSSSSGSESTQTFWWSSSWGELKRLGRGRPVCGFRASPGWPKRCLGRNKLFNFSPCWLLSLGLWAAQDTCPKVQASAAQRVELHVYWRVGPRGKECVGTAADAINQNERSAKHLYCARGISSGDYLYI